MPYERYRPEMELTSTKLWEALSIKKRLFYSTGLINDIREPVTLVSTPYLRLHRMVFSIARFQKATQRA